MYVVSPFSKDFVMDVDARQSNGISISERSLRSREIFPTIVAIPSHSVFSLSASIPFVARRQVFRVVLSFSIQRAPFIIAFDLLIISS